MINQKFIHGFHVFRAKYLRHSHIFMEMGLDPSPFLTLLQKFMLHIQSETVYASIISQLQLGNRSLFLMNTKFRKNYQNLIIEI